MHLSLQAVYCLGSKVRVLTTLSDDCAIIAFKNEHADQILQLIHDKGNVLKQLCSSLLICNMKKCSILWRGPWWPWLDLQLPVQSVPITTKVVNPVLGEVYSIQHYVIKLSLTCNRPVVFSGYYSFLHQ